jgi:hypothetical protein
MFDHIHGRISVSESYRAEAYPAQDVGASPAKHQLWQTNVLPRDHLQLGYPSNQ